MIYRVIGLISLILITYPLISRADASLFGNLDSANLKALSGSRIPGVEGDAIRSLNEAQKIFNSASKLSCDVMHDGGNFETSIITCVNGSANLTGVHNFDSGGKTIIRVPGDLRIANNTVIKAPLDSLVFVVDGAAEIGAGAFFEGTILARGNITWDRTVTISGRVISINGSLNGDTSVIDCSSCIATSSFGWLTINKKVINDDGAQGTVDSFQFFISGTEIKAGEKYALLTGDYEISEFLTPNYLASPWEGDCSPTGSISILPGESKNCSITNNDIVYISTSSAGEEFLLTKPLMPSTGRRGNIALALAIFGGIITGYAGISRKIKTLNK